MSATDAAPAAAEKSSAERAITWPPEFEPVETELSPEAVQERLLTEARRGRLDGYEKNDEGFKLDALGTPFEYDLLARARREGERTVVSFSIAIRRGLPILFVVVLLLTVEPGRYFTDKLIPGRWGWIDTRLWYYPLTIIPLPFVWRTCVRKSRESACKHAREQIEKVRKALARPA
ncbi:MAG: hypothetical protein JJU33_01110 [Phycisphaerales bacterium]|nr:hypothetical protein [Phycisphaerales bacterium]